MKQHKWLEKLHVLVALSDKQNRLLEGSWGLCFQRVVGKKRVLMECFDILYKHINFHNHLAQLDTLPSSTHAIWL